MLVSNWAIAARAEYLGEEILPMQAEYLRVKKRVKAVTADAEKKANAKKANAKEVKAVTADAEKKANAKKARSDYMKFYMRNVRAQKKEDNAELVKATKEIRAADAKNAEANYMKLYMRKVREREKETKELLMRGIVLRY